jgi:uncharacterized protein YdcH (DUF465 family)
MALKLSWYTPPHKVIDRREHFRLQQQVNSINHKIKKARDIAEMGIPVLATIPNFAATPIVFPEVVPSEDPEFNAIAEESQRVDEMLSQIEKQSPWTLKGADDGEAKL